MPSRTLPRLRLQALWPLFSILLTSMATVWGQRGEDPLVGFHFQLDIGGVVSGYFTECSEIGSSSEVVRGIVVIDGVETIVKNPGALTYYNITLKRGITASMDMWNWRKEVEDGLIATARSDISITMLDQTLTPVAQWNFENAWPTAIEMQPVSDTGGIIEVITLTSTGYERVQ